MKRVAAFILTLVMAVSSAGYVFASSSEADSKVAAELKTVLDECVSDGTSIEAIGYERHPQKEGEDMTENRFFSVIKDKEYVDRIVGLLKSANVFGIESDKPSQSNKYYTETLKIKYKDGKVCELGTDGNKLVINGKEYKVYGLDSLRDIVHEATYKTRPALETFGEALSLDLYGRLYTVDGEYYFDGKPDENMNALHTEKDFKITDADVASYIVWMINNAALPFDGVEDKASDGGTLFMLETDGGYVLEMDFHKNGRVVLHTGKHPSAVYGSYMLPYDTAIEILNIILDSSDGNLDSVEDVEAATDALIDEFYEKCERIGEEADDTSADDIKDTALADSIASLLSNSSEILSFSFTAERRGGVSRSKADAPYDFSYMTSDSAYINEAVKLLAGCEFSKKPKTHEEVGYSDVTVKFNTKNAVLELRAYSNGKVSYNGTYYGYLEDMCKEVYKLRAREAGDSFIVKSGILGKYDIDLFSKDIARLVYHGIDMGAVVIDDAEKIEKIGVCTAKYITLTGFQRVNSGAAGGVQPETFTVEYANGKKSKIYFKRPFGNNNIIIEGDALQYSVPSSDFYTFRRFFEVYAKYDSLNISDWAKPELEKAVLYGFGGIGGFSDDYSKYLTRLEVCDIIVYPVNDIIGISTACIEPAYIDVYSQSVLDLTSAGAVEGKDVITVDGAVWKRVFAPDDLVTREELSKIVCGIYGGGDYEYFSGYKADFELPKVTKTSFADDSEISDWAKPYVEKAKELGIFKGDDKGNFNPKGNCTKEEVVAVAVRLYEMMLKNIED